METCVLLGLSVNRVGEGRGKGCGEICTWLVTMAVRTLDG